jgi:thiol-disulfide isomerase/thioredoxin
MRIVLLLSLLSSNLVFGAKITGHFAGAPAGDRFTVRVNRQYIDGSAQNYELNTGNLGQFSVEIVLTEPQYITLQHNSDILVLFVEPNDQLEVIADVFGFPHEVSFDGKGAENNICLKAFLKRYPVNFNEFTKTRFKIANYWATIDEDLDVRMRKTNPTDFTMYLEERSMKHLRFIDDWDAQYSNRLSSVFKQFMSTEILYRNGFESIVYANVYKAWHNIPDNWLNGALQLPLEVDLIGSESYRRFIMAYMADRCKKAGKDNRAVEHQYLDGGQLLANKPRAFFQSEIICNGLKQEQYDEILPYYSTFLRENTLDEYEQKITDLFEKKVAFTPGVVAPPFVGIDNTGVRIADTDLRGSVVYLNFWASYCGTCIKKMEYINSRYGELRDKGIKVVNVSLDQNRETWLSNVSRFQVNGFNLLNASDETSNFAKDFRVEAVPTYFIIDKYGSFVQKPISHKPEDIVKYLLERGTN